MQKFILDDTFYSTAKEMEKAIMSTDLSVFSIVNSQNFVIRAGNRVSGNIIFEVFDPKLLYQVLVRNLEAGILPPVRIYLYEENSRAIIEYEDCEMSFARFGMDDIGRKIDLEVHALLDRVFKGKSVKRIEQGKAAIQ